MNQKEKLETREDMERFADYIAEGYQNDIRIQSGEFKRPSRKNSDKMKNPIITRQFISQNK